MVHERNGVLVPAGRVLAKVHADQVREPGHVLDLKLLELEIGVENTEVEAVLEGHRVLAGSLGKHDLIELLLAAVSLVFILLSAEVHISEKAVIFAELQGLLEGFGVLDGLQLFVALRVEVSHIANELGAVGLTASRVSQITEAKRVSNDLDGATVTFKLEEVLHDSSASLVEVQHAELVEVLEPDFLDTELDLVKTVVLHHLRDEVNAVVSIFISG